MRKKTIALFCLFLTLLFACAACKKHSPYGVIIVDQKGMEHVIMTDANGVTVIDAEGNLVEVMTDSDSKKPIAAPTENGTVHPDQLGEYETHPVTFPGIVEKGDTAEDAVCSVTVPEGWEQIGNNMLILRHKETDTRVAICTDIGGTVTGAINQLHDDLKELDVEETVRQTDVTIDGVLATRIQYEIGNVTQINYLLITEAGKVCRITATVEKDDLSAVDVDSLIRSIDFK